MKKGYYIVLGFIALGILVVWLFWQPLGPLGIATNQISYSGATNTSTACVASTSTTVVATSTSRTSFVASISGATTTYLCRGVACVAATGITLTSNSPRFEQLDSYIGPYSCLATSSSTITSSYSQ